MLFHQFCYLLHDNCIEAGIEKLVFPSGVDEQVRGEFMILAGQIENRFQKRMAICFDGADGRIIPELGEIVHALVHNILEAVIQKRVFSIIPQIKGNT